MRSFGALLLAGVLPQQAAARPSPAEARERRAGSGVSLGDIEAQLRSLGTAAAGTVSRSAPTAAALAAAGGAAVLAVVYLYGRRRGRRRATVLEIRRV